MNRDIDEAVRVLDKGGIVVFPTDTAFGIGCRIDDESAIERLFQVRGRPSDQAVPVLVSDLEMAKKYLLDIPKDVIDKLLVPYWPGALTAVLRCRKNLVPPLVRGGGDTVGVRMPDNATMLEIIRKTGVPVLGPSANFHGRPTPYRFSDLDPYLLEQADYCLNGICSLKKTSTVIDCTVNPWRILRKGALEIKI